jgi:hypothetical protein
MPTLKPSSRCLSNPGPAKLPGGRKKGFVDFLKEVGQRTVSAFENHDYPVEELVKR